MSVEYYDAQLRAILINVPPPPASAADAGRQWGMLLLVRKQFRALRTSVIRETRIVRTRNRAISKARGPLARLAGKTLGRQHASVIRDAATALSAATMVEVLPYERVRIDLDNALLRVEQNLLACRQWAPSGN